MVNARKRVVEGGIEGYRIPKQDNYYKPYVPFISKSKELDFVSRVQKDHSSIPPPDKYETGVSMLLKKNLSIYKRER